MPETTVELVGNAIKIRIGGKLHAAINCNELRGFQSYIIGGKSFHIDYLLGNGSTLDCRYDRRDLWEQILHGLDQVALFIRN